MGTNDHTPSKATRTPRRKRGELKEVLSWTVDAMATMADFVAAVSAAGGYVGFGRNSSGDCLLLYVKLDDWQERIAVEDMDQLDTLATELVQEVRL